MRRRTMRVSLVLITALGVLLLQSLGPDDPTRMPIASAQAPDPIEKIQGGLRSLNDAAQAGRPPTTAQARSVGVATVGGLVRVVVEAAGGRTSQAGLVVQGVGGRVEASYADLVQALAPTDRLLDLAADLRVRYVRAPFPVVERAIAGQGVGASGAAAWHAAGITGTGVKVAVFDSGFRGVQQRKNEGDIPANTNVVDLCNGGTEGNEHGTGVAEIVHEMAPGAELLMYCVTSSEVSLGQAKEQARAAGASIISMSLAYFNSGRGDGTGPASSPEGIVAEARSQGILWVNSAGNAAAGEAWHGPWNDPNNDGFLDWVNGDRANTLTLAAGQEACGYLRWDAWPTTAQDFALEVYDSQNFTTPLAGTDNPQTGTQAPVEQTCYRNETGADREIAFAVRRVNATTLPPRFDFNAFNQRLRYFKTDSNIDVPATSPSAFAVGAVCWQSGRLEDYSSRGPTIDGRIKPDISAQSVVSSGSYGPWQSCPANADGAGGFNDTSAAAPHMAGAAALVKQANAGFSSVQLQTFLEGRSRDLGPAGKDTGFGTGLLTLGAPPANTGPTPTHTPTLTPTQTAVPPPAPGTPSVRVGMTKIAANRLQVTLTAATGQTISGVAWTLPANASAESTTGTPLPTGVTLPAGMTSTSFVLIRHSGESVTLPIVVNGTFGQWRTLVGGGPNAW